jgi:hypothetical protein
MQAAWHCGGVAPIRADAARQGCATFRIALLAPLLGAAPEGVAYLARNRRFESTPLQRGVTCEPDLLSSYPQRRPSRWPSWGVGRCGEIEKTSLISLTSRRGGGGHTWSYRFLACKRAQETDADGLPPRLVRRNRGRPTGVSVVRFPAGVAVIGTDIGRLSSSSCGTCPKASRGSNDTMVEGASRKHDRAS